jgi:hypothetical protein
MASVPGTEGVVPTGGDWLEVARPHLSPELAEKTALIRLRAVAQWLPGDLLLVLENRLGPRSGPVDLSLRLREPEAARRLAQRVYGPLWWFLSHWGEKDLEHRHISNVWLEFDLDGQAPETLNPSICAKLRTPFDGDWLVDTLFPALQGEPLSPAQNRLVRACFEAIPPPGYLLYAFCMLPRPGRPLRMEVYGLTPTQMLEYLGRITPQWIPHFAGPASLFDGIERTHLSIDIVDGEISPRIGIEGSYERQPKREPRWRELFDRLVAAGLCTEEKRDASLAWPGWDSFWTAPDRWPMEAGIGVYCIRALSHVKVVCRPDRGPEAKVYLLFGPHTPAGKASSGPGVEEEPGR